MSADIIPFVPRRHRKRDLAIFDPTATPDDLVMDHVDTAPCEYVWLDADDAVPRRERPMSKSENVQG